MSSKTITILFPKVFNRPAGGAKIMLEYANRFAREGYQVTIASPVAVFWDKKPLWYKLRLVVKGLYQFTVGTSCSNWFSLDRNIKEKYVISLDYRFMPKNDTVYIATAAETAVYLNNYPLPNNRKFYFIQGFEDWGMSIDNLIETYRYNMNKIVVSDWLRSRLKQYGIDSLVVKNGFDFTYFSLNRTISSRDPFSICLMYNPMPLKGFSYALNALLKTKCDYPLLSMRVFGVCERPDCLPDWVEYYQKPDKETHNYIYNNSAIFIGPSLNEGWGLPVGEAMICGCAVICTNNDGYLEMAKDKENAIVVPTEDSDAIVHAIKTLFDDPKERVRIAENGNKSIKAFSIENSFKRFNDIIQGTHE